VLGVVRSGEKGSTAGVPGLAQRCSLQRSLPRRQQRNVAVHIDPLQERNLGSLVLVHSHVRSRRDAQVFDLYVKYVT